MARRGAVLMILAAVVAAPLAPASAEQARAVLKTTLQSQDFPPDRYKTVVVKTVVAGHGQVAPHTHPGVEMAYVAGGAGVLTVEGQPSRSLTAGDSFSIPPGTVHALENRDSDPLTIVSTYVVDKDQPIASPAR